MKIGLTINNYYKDYIEEIAKMNNMPVTTICGIILQNFLDFNKQQRRYPIIRQCYKMVFAKTPKDEQVDPNFEEEQLADWDEMIEDLENFKPDSED